jgi:hypothetical protein
MATNPFVDRLLNGLGGDVSGTGRLTSISEQLQSLRTMDELRAQQAAAKTLTSTNQTNGGSGGSVLGTIGSVLGIGLGVSPLISGLVRLFGGGGTESAPVSQLTPFAAPGTIRLDAGFSESAGGRAFATDSAQGGSPRAITNGSSAAATPQITVNVQAMDSQSFLDRSDDIAQAVRRAMLESGVLNDVIRDL